MKSFKEFINEAPQINKFLSKEMMGKIRNQYADYIKQNHHNSELIDEKNKIYKLKEKEDTHYYRTNENNEPEEISSVDKDNVQVHSSKGSGSVENNINFMYIHAKNLGQVESHSSNTKGSKKMWMDVTKNPRSGYSVYHNYKGTENKADHDYLKKHEEKIWNNSMDAFDHKLILRKDK